MHVALHAGAHVTDEDRLLKCLISNRDTLSKSGAEVPGPRTYRKLLRDVMHTAMQDGVAGDTRDILLDAIVSDGTADRLILSNPGFFGTPKMATSGGVFYGAADARLGIFRQIFAPDTVELFFAVRNPATFLPAILPESGFDNLPEFLRGQDPAGIRWSELIERIRAAHPDLPVTVWCNEDTPLIWAQVVREMAGFDATVAIADEFLLLSEIMSKTGMQRFESYLAEHPGMTEVQKRRVIAAFLDKFAEESAIEEELDIPGWTEDVIDRLTDLYDEDLYRIQRISGVQMITP